MADTSPPLPANPPPAFSLYVGDLNPTVTDQDLTRIFSRYGILTSVRVCRDSDTRRSLCYAYVNFHLKDQAENALKCLNHTMLNGRPMRIMWSQKNPSHRSSGIGNLFVKNLDGAIDAMKLESMFAPYGEVTSCKVVVGQDRRSKGFGFVQFAKEQEALDAIAALDGQMFSGKKLYVTQLVRKSERELKSPKFKGEGLDLYVGNLDGSMTKDEISEKFSSFGELEDIHLDKKKQFAFLLFKSGEAAAAALKAMNGAAVGTTHIRVEMFQSKEQLEKRNQGANLYVKNLDPSMNEEMLLEQFSPYGSIVSAKVMVDGHGKSRGFGFVCFSSAEEAENARRSLHGKRTPGNHRLYVAVALRKEERARQLMKQLLASMKHSKASFYHDLNPSVYPGGTNLHYLPKLYGYCHPSPRITYSPQGNGHLWRGSVQVVAAKKARTDEEAEVATGDCRSGEDCLPEVATGNCGSGHNRAMAVRRTGGRTDQSRRIMQGGVACSF